MENAEFLKWIDDQIENKYRRDLQKARNPRDVKRLSLNALLDAIGMARGNISRLSRRGKPGDRLIKALAEYFEVPEVEVLRVAGRIPPINPSDELDAIILAEAQDLEIEDKALVRDYVQMLRARAEKAQKKEKLAVDN